MRLIRTLAAWLLGLAMSEIRLIGVDGEVLARQTVFLTTRRDSEGRIFVEPLNQPTLLWPGQDCFAEFIECDMASRKSFYQREESYLGAKDCLYVRIYSELTGDSQ